MDPPEPAIVSIYSTLTWNLYTPRRLYGLILCNTLWTVAFFYYSSNLTEEICSGLPKTLLGIGKIFYLVATIYFIMTLAARLRMLEDMGTNIDIGPTKKKFDMTDLIFLVGWLVLNIGMIIGFFKRSECDVSSRIFVAYFVYIILIIVILSMSICCVGWFVVSVTQMNKRQQDQNRELDQYNRL